MPWFCGRFCAKGCVHHGSAAVGQISTCQWPTFREISPPKGCMISIKTLRKEATKA